MFQTFNNMIASHNLRPTSTHPPYYQHTPYLHPAYTLLIPCKTQGFFTKYNAGYMLVVR